MAQKTLTWEQAKRELEISNPTLRAARIMIVSVLDPALKKYEGCTPTGSG
jgi:hypothetical protein